MKPKYKIEFNLKGKKEVINFDKLPKNIYYAEGYQNNSDKGKAYTIKLTDQGTSLVPIIVIKTGKQYKKSKRGNADLVKTIK